MKTDADASAPAGRCAALGMRNAVLHCPQVCCYKREQVVSAVIADGAVGTVAVPVPPSAKQSASNVTALASKSSVLLHGQPLHVQSVEPVPVANVPPNDSQSRCDWLVAAVLAPVSEAVAVAPRLLPDALSVAVSLAPAVVGAYWMVTVHDFFGPRLVAVHVSAVFENADEPVSETLSAPVAEPPEFLSVNVFDAVVPASIVP
jgi:hypothetical protein